MEDKQSTEPLTNAQLADDPPDDMEALCQRIIQELSFQYNSENPIGVITWFDSEFTADQWRRIENQLNFLHERATEQRKRAQQRERWEKRTA